MDFVSQRRRLKFTCVPVILLFATLLPLNGRAAEDIVYINNLGPFYYLDGTEKGVSYELIHRLAERRAYQGVIEAVPLKRRMTMLLNSPKAFGVLWREPAVESRFTWLFKILEDRVILMTLRKSPVNVDSLEAARRLRIGVVLGSPAEALARSVGFTHIEATSSAAGNIKKLAMGRIDAWIGFDSVAEFDENRGLDRVSELRRGMTIGKVDLYFACGSPCDEAQALRWKEAYHALTKDGTVKTILEKYRF